MFGAPGSSEHLGCGIEDPFESGVDIYNGGYVWDGHTRTLICTTPLSLTDPSKGTGHYHDDWTADYRSGNMDGFCHLVNPPNDCPPYAYVPQTEAQPYFDIATDYGYANYMFQTNEGPSFPAHQFLFSGTSAPLPYSNNPPNCTDGKGNSFPCYEWFDADNMANTHNGPAGCIANSSQQSYDIDPLNLEWFAYNSGYPCYDHPTLIDILPQNVTWRYYAPTQGDIWTAPTAISHICGGSHVASCPNFDPKTGKYRTNVTFESHNNLAPIFNDIATCNLANLSWVIPDARWSDHPEPPPYNTGLGPLYVASIVDAIGLSGCTDPNNGQPLWKNVAILITWDDWGGWYDHVPPFDLNSQNHWGAAYTYGFRVPLLVVSPYTKAGYVSGAISGPPSYPPPPLFTHDFGSILGFIEYNYLGWNGIGKIGGPNYPYADNFAPDYIPNVNVPLQDFFQFPYRDFNTIPLPPSYGANYFAAYAGDPSGSPDD